MFSLGRRGSQRSVNIWPGFVDGLASLLLVVVFVLMVFVIAQFFLSAALTGRDEALQRLEQRVSELSELLSLERSASAELRVNVAQLSSELQASISEREEMSDRLSEIRDERDILRDRLAAARSRAEDAEAELDDAYAALESDQEEIQAQIDQISILQSLRDELRQEVRALESRLAAAQQLAQEREEELVQLDEQLAQVQLSAEERAERIAVLESRLAEAQEQDEVREEQIAGLRSDLDAQRTRAQALAGELTGAVERLTMQRELTAEQEEKIDLLNRQLASLRRQVSRLNAALEAAEAQMAEKDVQIANLGERLNVALADRVQELARYRSEFFGRLREVLGDRQDVRIVGDRFVFQSEVLFDTASARLGGGGREQIVQLADTLKELIEKIPDDLDWVLRVDGHTDHRPIRTARFPSNWELSTARATEVVRVLIEEGIPPDRLAAAGFGEYQPLDDSDDEIALRRNRRIEFKLTQS